MSTFKNRELVRIKCMNESDLFVSVLEPILKDDQVSALETALFPSPNEEALSAIYEKTLIILDQSGVSTDNAVYSLVKSELDKHRLVVEPVDQDDLGRK